MPPKAKFTKEEIINTALEIARTDGINFLTARALGKKLGSSARPIFTIFENMDEVHKEVIKAAKVLYNQYIESGLTHSPAFKGVGTQYIMFAIKEPKLFQLLFMTEQDTIPNLSGVLPQIDENYVTILKSVKDNYKLDDQTANKLYQHLWIYTHGIASLYATKMCKFTQEEISEMITEVCISLLKNIKAGKNND